MTRSLKKNVLVFLPSLSNSEMEGRLDMEVVVLGSSRPHPLGLEAQTASLCVFIGNSKGWT